MWVEMVTYAQIFAFTHAPYPQGLCGFHDIGAQPLQSVGWVRGIAIERKCCMTMSLLCERDASRTRPIKHERGAGVQQCTKAAWRVGRRLIVSSHKQICK